VQATDAFVDWHLRKAVRVRRSRSREIVAAQADAAYKHVTVSTQPQISTSPFVIPFH
jgi:hypothetical protein